MNQISNLTKLEFKKSVLIMGSAPSLKTIKKYKSLAEIKIGIGDVPWRAANLGPFDYWITANTVYPLPWNKKHLEHLLRSRANILLSSVSVNSLNNLDSTFAMLKELRVNTPLTFYDQRHFRGTPCKQTSSCCSFSKMFVTDPSIQELLSGLQGKSSPAYSEGDSVFLHALALAVILQSKHIYIIGVEIPLVYRNYKYYRDLKSPFESYFEKFKRIVKRFIPKYRNQIPATSHDQVRFFHDVQKIIDIAVYFNIKVYSLSRTSALNFINGINIKE